MGNLHATISIPIPYFNLLTIITSTCILLWGMRAMKRLARLVAVRTAALNDSLVMIRGFGHNLINFEGAPHSHMSALIHTRPAKPPQQMNILYLPYLVKSMDLVLIHDEFRLETNLWVATKTFIIVLSNFKPINFKEKFHSMKDACLQMIHDVYDKSDIGNKTPADLMSDMRKYPWIETLIKSEVCQHVSHPTIVQPGNQTVYLPLFTYGISR